MPKTKSRKEESEATELPSTIARSDKNAQKTWQKAHESAVKTYGEGRSAYRVAYAALKHSYEKKGDRWVKKAEKGPSDPQAATGPTTNPKSIEGKKPTAGGKVAKTEKEAEEKRKEAKREDAKARRERNKS